jgi:hypothetical protein
VAKGKISSRNAGRPGRSVQIIIPELLRLLKDMCLALMVPNRKLNINFTPSPFCFYILQNYGLKVVYVFRRSDITLHFRIPQYARSGGNTDLTAQVGTVIMLVLLTVRNISVCTKVMLPLVA